jgi:hypothetical protein
MNDEMMMKGGSGMKCKPQYLRECWTFLIHIFLHQMRKQCLEFALPNPGEICKHLADAYNSNSHARRLSLSYFCMRKQVQRNQYNSANLLRKFVSEKLSIIDPLWRRRNPCNLWYHWHCCQKTTTSFVKVKKDWKRGGRKRKVRDH